MLTKRWKRCLCLLTFWISGISFASTIYTSPMLNEANGLVDIVPMQAKALATNYLTQRKLADKSEKSPSTISRDEADSRFRTPGATIDALKILAKAEFNLDQQGTAFNLLDEALNLAEEYQLPYVRLETQILKTRLEWTHTRDSAKAQEALEKISQAYSEVGNPEQLARGINYKVYMLKAEIASYDGNIDRAMQYYDHIKPYIDQVRSSHTIIDYHTAKGKSLLDHNLYNKALSELLISYWRAVEDNSSAQLAKINRLLAELFFDRKVLDKALDHLSQAADFYDNYASSPTLAHVLKMMGDVYYQQGKYNLALVHYFNVIDHERSENNISRIIEIRISLAATYLQLYNYTLSEQYLSRAEDLLEYADIPTLKTHALLLNAGLSYHQGNSITVIENAQKALALAQENNDLSLEKNAHRMLYLGYEQSTEFDKALVHLKQFNKLASIEQEKLNLISEDAFRQQKEFIEQTLHFAAQADALVEVKGEYHKFQKIAFSLFVLAVIFFLVLLRRGHLIRIQKDKIDGLNENLFTHSRSGLRNLRMLNAKLPASLEKSSHNFEQWHVGELIHEPLNDRLRFVMIDVPFLRNMYLQHGYSDGLKLEKAFGEHLKTKITNDARIYHFSDANLLYIEPNSENGNDPEVLFDKIQSWVKDFKPELKLNRLVRVGFADYPFLPRAYTAINDKELLDILLMSTDAARSLSMKENSSQWVYFKAIENAPAASLATDNVRKACKHAMSQGLIKVHSSYQNEESIKKLLKDD